MEINSAQKHNSKTPLGSSQTFTDKSQAYYKKQKETKKWMWFISPPVAEHKEWGVLLTLGMAQSQPSHAQVGMRNTLCP